MHRHALESSRTCAFLFACFSALACASPGSGGSVGVAAGGVGGQPGSTCSPAFHNEGCAFTTGQPASRVQCGANAKWALLAVCDAGKTCKWLPDPAAPGTNKRVTECSGSTATGSDAGGSDGLAGHDTPGGQDTGGTDASPQPDVAKDSTQPDVSPTDLGGKDTTPVKDIVIVGDTGPDTAPSPLQECAQANCPSQTQACVANTACFQAMLCMATCPVGDVALQCLSNCLSKVAPEGQQALGALLNCAQGPCLIPGSPLCGNGKCETGETATSCKPDCGAVCGNGKCEPGETATSCKPDCGPVCGNGKCEVGETATSCKPDCGTTNACGNGICGAGETPANCPPDCQAPASCGDGTCQAGETATNCAPDCDPVTKCIIQACGKELAGCFDNANCAGIFQCFQGCSNDACEQACYDNASTSAKQLYAAFAGCATNSGCL